MGCLIPGTKEVRDVGNEKVESVEEVKDGEGEQVKVFDMIAKQACDAMVEAHSRAEQRRGAVREKSSFDATEIVTICDAGAFEKCYGQTMMNLLSVVTSHSVMYNVWRIAP
jgi:hypothetical protein